MPDAGLTYDQLRTHNKRIAGMLADPECVGELLLVGMGMARCLDLEDPPWREDGHMNLATIAYAVYGRYRLGRDMLLPRHQSADGDSHPRKRIVDVFRQDRRRYSASIDGDRGPGMAVCGRPMLRREGLCGRSASWDQQRRLTDPATGKRHTVGACSQPKCRAWFADLLARNAAELKAHPTPVPAANTGGVLERHLPEIDWWKVWRHVDEDWAPPPEGERFVRPTLQLVLNDQPDIPGHPARPGRPRRRLALNCTPSGPTSGRSLMHRLPALSLWRPWPTLIFDCGKDVENRSWPTHYRGDLLIAAAQGRDPKALGFARDVARLDGTLSVEQEIALDLLDADLNTYPTGILGVVELYDICAWSKSHPGQRCACSPWASPGQFHWKIRNPRPFPVPIPHAGKQRMWAVDDRAWPAVHTQLRAVNRQPA